MVELPSWSIWKNAPEGATYCFKPLGVFFKPDSDNKMALHYSDDKWAESGYEYDELRLINLFEPRPAAVLPDGVNQAMMDASAPYVGILDGGRLTLPPDFLAKAINKAAHSIQDKMLCEPVANKYDRTITGKYGTGQCTVDVYRVLNAFGPLSPEIDHDVKKLLAPGSRGHKDEKQDLLEAIQSIEARLQYLEAVNG